MDAVLAAASLNKKEFMIHRKEGCLHRDSYYRYKKVESHISDNLKNVQNHLTTYSTATFGTCSNQGLRIYGYNQDTLYA